MPDETARVRPPAEPLPPLPQLPPEERGLTPPARPPGVAPEEMPRVRLSRGRLLASMLFVVSTVAFLYFVLPKLLGLRQTWQRIEHGNPWWLALGALLEICSFLGYVALFRGVFLGSRSRIGWRESYEITMAGLAATRLFASAGAGGVALTAWALRRSGLASRLVATRMIAFMALLYAIYMITLVVDGLGLYTGLFEGSAPFAITVVPAIFGATVVMLFLGAAALPRELEARLERRSQGHGRARRLVRRLAAIPAATAAGVRAALSLLRRRDGHLLGALAWWGFDIAVLWACFRAFGGTPPWSVIVMSYFVGMLGNTLPLPGGIGGVDGGMIGAFSAFGVSVQLAVVAVLAYRVLAFWLPTLPGAVAYFQLRRTVHRWQHEDVQAEPAGATAAPAPSYT
jgi:uncharacterized protein (TIRG00374 family)